MQTFVKSLVRRGFDLVLGAAWRWKARVAVFVNPEAKDIDMPIDRNLTAASEALVAMPLPKMLESLGLAVAHANQELAKVPGPGGAVMKVTDAQIDVNVAISVQSSENVNGELKLGLQAFSVNAGYARSFGFKEEASSRISMTLKIAPPDAA